MEPGIGRRTLCHVSIARQYDGCGQYALVSKLRIVETLEIHQHFTAHARHGSPHAPANGRSVKLAEGQQGIDPERRPAIRPVDFHVLDRMAFHGPVP